MTKELAPSYKVDSFREFINNIENTSYVIWIKQMIASMPDYNWYKPASSTGKYHNKQQCAKGGQIIHVKMALSILEHFFRMKNNYSSVQKDEMRCALILHDAYKYGNPEANNEYTVFEHPLLAKQWILENAPSYIKIDSISRIASMVAAHSGQWNTSKRSEAILPIPSNEQEFLIHLCDYLASRNNLSYTPKETKKGVFKRVAEWLNRV